MRAGYKLSAIASTLSLILCLAFSRSMPPPGSITGTVQSNGTPPHMRGIDMSKDPVLRSATHKRPVSMETVVVGSGGGLENVALYISEGLRTNLASSAPPEVPVFDQKGLCTLPTYLRWT